MSAQEQLGPQFGETKATSIAQHHKNRRVAAEHGSMVAYAPSVNEGRNTAFHAAMWGMALESTSDKHTRRHG